ncbi:MAG: FHA domain-containing protein [Acidobacteria bacterium]|nr:FHA domain-containing protein [Acidobacteriota bacterium]
MDFEVLGKLTKDINGLQKQQTVLLERIEKLTEKADTVSEVVFARIMGDYQQKLDTLNMELGPLYDQLRLKKAELIESVSEVEEDLKAYMVEKEEISVRAELGEFSQKKAASKIEALEKENEDKFDRLNKLKSELEKVNKVLAAEVGEQDMPSPLLSQSKEAGLPDAVPDDIQEETSSPVPPSTLSEDVPDAELMPPPPPRNAVTGDTEKTILDLGEEVQQGSTLLFRPPTLTIVSGEQEGTEFRLKMGVTNIGSAKENDIVMSDPSIAEKHAQITFGPDGFTIYDYNTPGGILVNGQRVSERLVQNGDNIQIGDIELRFSN